MEKPTINQTHFKKRREQLLANLPKSSIAILKANEEITRSNDTHYRFRQNSHFFYLTGFEEPNAFLILAKDKNNKTQTTIFVRPKNPLLEKWEGKRLGVEDAAQTLSIDRAMSVDEFAATLCEQMQEADIIYYCLGEEPALDKQVLAARQTLEKQVRAGIQAPKSMHAIGPLLDEMRLIKDEQEIEVMRYVGDLSARAHIDAMQQAKRCEYEYQLEATLTHTLMQGGCKAVAYDSIVASGAHACILHYTENNAKLNDNDLILIDAGGEYHNYAADITRTFPKNGKFNHAQKAIYELVLKAQLAGIELIKPGALWDSIQTVMIQVLTQGLVKLGILEGKVEDLISNKAYFDFYMHNSGHWLGLDVHDVGAYKVDGKFRPLKAGMVLTVEPGLYLDERLAIPDEYKGIGVRIEDDILVTESGYENLTAKVPKSIEEIETLMAC